MNPCCRRGPGPIGGAPAGWTPSKAADRRWTVIGDGDSPRSAVDPGLGLAQQQSRGLAAASRRQRPRAVLDGLAPACARAWPLASTIRHQTRALVPARTLEARQYRRAVVCARRPTEAISVATPCPRG